MDFKNPEILASAFNYCELLIKETLLIQEQQPEINVDNFSTPVYLFSFLTENTNQQYKQQTFQKR